MTAGLRFVVVFTRGGLKSSAKNSTSRFPTICIYFFGKGFCKVHEEPFESGLNCFHAVEANARLLIPQEDKF